MGEAPVRGAPRGLRAPGITIQQTGVGPIVEFYVSDTPVHDYRTAMQTDQRPKRMLAAGMREHGVFGGGGRYNVSLAHGAAELELMLDAVEAILDRAFASGELTR